MSIELVCAVLALTVLSLVVVIAVGWVHYSERIKQIRALEVERTRLQRRISSLHLELDPSYRSAFHSEEMVDTSIK